MNRSRDPHNDGLAMPMVPELVGELRRLLEQVPVGKVTTFGDLAEGLGDIGASRWVAEQLGDWRRENSTLPWHRVVRRTGELASGTAEEQREQAELLRQEEIAFLDESRLDLSSRWKDFDSIFPLRTLAAWQETVAKKACWDETFPCPDVVAGVDLSYASPTEAVAAYVECDAVSGEVLFEETHRTPVTFPYIPGYLTARELPAMVSLIERISATRSIAPVLLVDGSGRLHPRRFGIAVALGLLTGTRTIGVSKHRLCGLPKNGDDSNPDVALWEGDELLGYRLDGGSKRRTMYVSPGTGLDAESAMRIVRRIWGSRRLTGPIHRADALSREVAGTPVIPPLPE